MTDDEEFHLLLDRECAHDIPLLLNFLCTACVRSRQMCLLEFGAGPDCTEHEHVPYPSTAKDS